MYAKLVFRNARRSIKDYLIYIVTMTVCVTLFYGFLSISSKYYSPDIGVEYNLDLLSDGMRVAICTVTLLLLFLIRYVNNYMIYRKQKEFAIQTIMGMEQLTTARLFFAETFFMGLLSIGLGIVFGMIGSQFVTAMLLSSYGQPFHLTWTLFPDTVLLTICFFTGVFILVGLWNIRTIRKIKIIDMLYAEKKNEKDFRKGKWMPVIAILYSIFLVFMVITGISKMYFYFDSRFAVPVKIMYWGNILAPITALLFSAASLFIRRKRRFRALLSGLLVGAVLSACFAAIVPAMVMKYYLPSGAESINQYLLFLLIDLIFSISAFIYLLNDAMCFMKEKLPKHRYHEENLFFYGQILSKLKTVTKTMTLICLTLVLSICLFMAVPALIGWASGYLNQRSVYDVQIFTSYNDVYEESDLPDGNYAFITEFFKENNIKTAYDRTFHLYLPQREEFHQRIKYEFPVVAISLTDFNYLLSMRGYEPISLNDHEFATQWQSIAADEDRREFLNSHTVISTDNGKLKLSSEPEYHFDLGETLYNTYTDVIYILPDKVCESLLPVMHNRYVKTVEPISFENSIELQRLFSEKYKDTEEGPHYFIRTSTQQISVTKAYNFVLQTSMSYGAIVLLVICFTILSLQQLSDAGHYRYRFGVLKKMGVEESHINRLVFRQLAVWFGLPVIVAASVSAVLTVYFFRMISIQISAYIGAGTLFLQVGIMAAILIVLLLCYFISTWLLFKRSINS